MFIKEQLNQVNLLIKYNRLIKNGTKIDSKKIYMI